MAIDAVESDVYEYILVDDREDECPTVFVLSPLAQFEHLRISSSYAQIFAGNELGGEDKKEFIKGLLAFFASDDSDKFQRVFEAFFAKHLKEIKNLRVKGELKTLKDEDADISLVQMMSGFEILSDAINRVSVTEEERKN